MANHYSARIYVTLRPSVLDPAGTAVESGLQQMSNLKGIIFNYRIR